jgi:hypothetical protein
VLAHGSSAALRERGLARVVHFVLGESVTSGSARACAPSVVAHSSAVTRTIVEITACVSFLPKRGNDCDCLGLNCLGEWSGE